MPAPDEPTLPDEEEDEALDWDLEERDAFLAEHDTDDYVPDIEPVVVVAEDE